MNGRRCRNAKTEGKVTEGWRDEAFDAVREGDVAALETVLSSHPGVVSLRTESGTPLLHLAAERDHVDVARRLLDAGAEVEAEAPWGQTAFEWAANMGSEATAALLEDRGAERQGLWTAAALGRLDEVEACFDSSGGLEPGAGRSPRPGADLSGWTEDSAFLVGDPVSDACYIACRNGSVDVARFLLNRGADPDARGYFGASALHWAAINGHEDVVQLLLEAGADRHLRDPEFDATPAGWAREGGQDHLVEILENGGDS